MSSVVASGTSGQATTRDPHRIWRVGALLRVLAMACAIILLNGFPARVGVIRSPNTPGVYEPMLTPGFLALLPILDAWWGMALALTLVKLHDGRWLPGTRWAGIVLDVLEALVALRLLTSGPLIGVSGTWAIRGRLSGVYLLRIGVPTAATLDLVVKVILGMVLFGALIGVLVHIRRLLPKPVTK